VIKKCGSVLEFDVSMRYYNPTVEGLRHNFCYLS